MNDIIYSILIAKKRFVKKICSEFTIKVILASYLILYTFYASANSTNQITLAGITYNVVNITNVGANTWTAPSGVTSVEYLIVGGGGGASSGGGGAGGVLTGTQAVTAGTLYPISVGNGGTATNGLNSSIFGLTALGGGRGGDGTSAGIDGGSGGGSGYDLTSGGGNGTPGQGSNGGFSNRISYGAGGGGGGAGQAGTNATTESLEIGRGGNGGNGVSSSITGASTFYGGGGGGGANTSGVTATGGGIGGNGGGGNGARDQGGSGSNGTVNTGGGGGGAEPGGAGGSGGSGIVIIRYVLAPEIGVSSATTGAVADGGADTQGTVPVATATIETYTVNNTGTSTLTLTGTPTAASLTNVAAPVISAPLSLTIAPGGSTTFTVSYTPTLVGAFSFELVILSDDADESPYNVTVSGTAQDAVAPVFSGVPANISQSIGAGLSSSVINFTPPTATDNIDGAIVPVLVSSPTVGLNSGSAFPLGVTTLTYTATDASGNIATQSFTITVSGPPPDVTPPIFTAPPTDISQTTDPGNASAVVTFPTPTVIDNASGKVTTVLVSSPTPGLKSGSVFPPGITTLTFTATDAAGNQRIMSFTITISDTEKPVFSSFPDDMALTVDYPATTVRPSWTEPTASDNASGSISITQTAGPASGAAFPIGITSVTYTATDNSGNVATQSFTVTVTARPPGSVTFIMNSQTEGTYSINSPEPTLNTSINVHSGSGSSASIPLRPGSFPVTFAVPNSITIKSAQCNTEGSTFNTQAKSGTLVIASGVASICTITTQQSLQETVKKVGQLLETRSQMILQHQPNLSRRLDRLEGKAVNNGGINGFGLAIKNDKIPFSAQIGAHNMSFSYSLRQSQVAGMTPSVTGSITSVLGAFGISPRQNSNTAGSTSERTKQNRRNGNVSTYEKENNSAANAPLNNPYNLALNPSFSGEYMGVESGLAPFDIWAEGYINRFETGNDKGHFGIIHLGADYQIKPKVLLGLSLQGDWTDVDGLFNDSKTEGFGFIISPYVTVKLSERFYFDARTGWGRAYNDISPFGTYTDAVSSERWIASAALIGTWKINSIKITPEARLSYFKETSDAYTDSLNVSIPSVEVETGVFEFGPTISKDFITDKGSLYSPFLTLEGVWTFSQKNTAKNIINSKNLASEGTRARIKTGVDVYNKNGSNFTFSGNYDGIGDSDFESWGVKLHFNYKF